MTGSVSSVITAIILKEIDIEMRNKIGKIKRIFEKQEHHYKLRGHFWTEENGAFLILIFNQLQCATEFYNYLSLIGYLDQCDPFFSDQHVTFQFLRCSSCSNIPVILTVLFLTLYQIFPKLWLQLWQHQMQAFWMIWDLGQSQDPLNLTRQ